MLKILCLGLCFRFFEQNAQINSELTRGINSDGIQCILRHNLENFLPLHVPSSGDVLGKMVSECSAGLECARPKDTYKRNRLDQKRHAKSKKNRVKALLTLFLLAIVTVAMASDQTITQSDRDKGIAELQGSRQAFLDATKGLTPAQWNFKAAPDRWSIAECAEHIALSEDFIFGVVSNQVMKTPTTPEKRDAVKGKDDLILKMMQDRSHKATAPEPIDPAKRPMPAEASVKQFLASRAHTIEYLKTTQDDLRDHFFDHPVPVIGTLDGYQWIMLISGHSRRHTLQILEVKADPN